MFVNRKKKKSFRTVKTILGIIIAIILFLWVNPYGIRDKIVNSFASADETLAGFETCSLVRVVDGDTLIVNLNNEEARVRLIGINTPESVAPESYGIENTEEGSIASEYTKSLLVEGQTLYLQKDTSDTDKYGRLLRYVWLDIPNNSDEATNLMLNAILVRDGYAEAKSYPPDTGFENLFTNLYFEAVKEGRGLWTN